MSYLDEFLARSGPALRGLLDTIEHAIPKIVRELARLNDNLEKMNGARAPACADCGFNPHLSWCSCLHTSRCSVYRDTTQCNCGGRAAFAAARAGGTNET